MTPESGQMNRLQVLLVEDEKADLEQFVRDLPEVFLADNVEVTLHPCADFQSALAWAENPVFRYDLIISDTYEGETKLRNAKVLEMVRRYRGSRFCPLVVYSSGVKPPELEESTFVRWADKGKSKDIEQAIHGILLTGIPQLARSLHDDIDRVGSSYLWTFLESHWDRLGGGSVLKPEVLDRLLRKRAAIQIVRLNPQIAEAAELSNVEGLEWYLYPPVSESYRLGEIIRKKCDATLHLILTPHCHLTVQQDEADPRADYVLTVRLLPAVEVIPRATAPKAAWSGNEKEKLDKLRRRTQLVAELGKPNGRFCFLPGFLDIPDAYCDLLQLESVPYKSIATDYDRIAVLDTPFAEGLQSHFTHFYSAVGLPNLIPERFRHLIEGTHPAAKG